MNAYACTVNLYNLFRLCQTMAAIVSGPIPAAATLTLGEVCLLLRELEQRWVSMPHEDQTS